MAPFGFSFWNQLPLSAKDLFEKCAHSMKSTTITSDLFHGIKM